VQQQLRAILGAVKLKDIGPEGKLHLDTLSQGDVGFGALDALDFNPPTARSRRRRRRSICSSTIRTGGRRMR
jgi:hypothetical protein